MIALAVAALSACGMFKSRESKQPDYQDTQLVPALEVPPDLLPPGTDETYTVPTTARRNKTASGDATQDGDEELLVLKDEKDGIETIRAYGEYAWVWTAVRAALERTNLDITGQDPELGIYYLQHGLAEAQQTAKQKRGLISRFFGKPEFKGATILEVGRFQVILDQADSAVEVSVRNVNGEFDQTLIGEQILAAVYLQMKAGPDGDTITIVPLPGQSQTASLAEEDAEQLALALGPQPAVGLVFMERGPGGHTVVKLPDTFDQAWANVGYSINEIGAEVLDTDRDQGIYQVEFRKKRAVGEYQVKLDPVERGTNVMILDETGVPDKSKGAKHLLSRLFDVLQY